MPRKTKAWSREQLHQMNEEAFLVDLLDMIKISPVTDDSDSAIGSMKSKLDAIEAMIQGRLDKD